MAALLFSLYLSRFECPHTGNYEIFVGDTMVLVCLDGDAIEPVTGPFDNCTRIDLDSGFVKGD